MLPPPPSPPPTLPLSTFSSHHTGVLRLSSLGEGGTRPASCVKLLEWLGPLEGSSGPGALCRGGRVEQRDLPRDRGG